MGSSRSQKSRKRTFKGNRFMKAASNKNDSASTVVPTMSERKVNCNSETFVPANEKLFGNQIFNLQVLAKAISCLCCPECFEKGICLVQDTVFGLASNFTLKCKNCNYSSVFCTSEKVNKMHHSNLSLVFGLRLIGSGHSGAKKLCSAMDLNTPSKTAFRALETKLTNAAEKTACVTMNEAALEIRKGSVQTVKCGVSVDGTWQRRGYSSLNGCVSSISIDSGKVLDIELMSKVCRKCIIEKDSNLSVRHSCLKHKGSSGSMEVIGVYRIFERAPQRRNLQYVDFYGDGDSKGYESVKDMYGKSSVTKYECIGHIQKRIGCNLRKLKAKEKGLGGRGKLSDVFIDKLQNYYGIAIRSNINNLEGMQSAVIAALFHCCSNAKQPMHGQCPVGPDSWCKFKQASATGKNYTDKSKGLPKKIMEKIKPVYMKLCDQNLLKKCLHGKTQNANESFNGVLWKFVPKNIFVELQTLKLGAYMAVIQFNKGFQGLFDILETLGVHPGIYTLEGFSKIDTSRVHDSRRNSLPNVKIARKKNRLTKKGKITKEEKKEGITYKCGEF